MRNHTLDLFKLIACVFVISLHVAGYPELPGWIVSNINLLSRWAVPFFFIAAGYYLSKKDNAGMLIKIKKTVIIVMVSCFIYLLFIFIKNKFSLSAMLREGLSMRFFLSGSYAHLWFLFSLIYGCIITSFFISDKKYGRSIFVASILVVFCWVSDIANSVADRLDVFYVARDLVSFPLMWVGVLIARTNHTISFNKALGVILISSVMTIIEVGALNKIFNFSLDERQFPLFCMPMAYGIFMLCFAVQIRENSLTRIGRDYSLGIYIVHYVWIYVFYYTLPAAYKTPSLLMIPLVLAGSIISLMFMRRYAKRAFMMLNGM